MNNKKYPTKKDVQRHTKELVTSMRQYIRGLVPADSVENSLRCLHGDLLVESFNDGIGGEDIVIRSHRYTPKLNFLAMLNGFAVIRDAKKKEWARLKKKFKSLKKVGK